MKDKEEKELERVRSTAVTLKTLIKEYRERWGYDLTKEMVEYLEEMK